LLLAVCIHKIPEGLALSALLLAAGLRRTVALVWVAAVEASTMLGGAIGLLAAPNISSFWFDPVLPHVGGGFIFLALHAVFGELIQHGRKMVFMNFAGGMLLIAALKLVLYIL
jgi:zinc transporter ZupT